MLTTTDNEPQSSSPVRPQSGTMTGIDIGRHSAKLVVVSRQSKGITVSRASCLRLTERSKANGRDLAVQLCSWLREFGQAHCRAFVATLPSSMVDYESIEVSAEAVELEVHSAMREILGNAYGDASYEYWIGAQGREPSSKIVHLAWTAGDYASQLSSGLSRGGWNCVGIDVPAQTLASIAELDARPLAPSLVVDIGAGDASFVLADQGNCKYVRNRIQFATDSAAGTISKSLDVDEAAAEQLLAHWGIGVVQAENTDPIQILVTQHLSEWLQQLTYEIQRTLNYLKHNFGAHAPTEVVLCGGGACVKGLPSTLPAALKLPVRFAQLPGNCTWNAAERFSPLYAQALASAMYGELS
ncbi:MAG: pilus assembly protein PilM [Pirellulaceae bacterium]